MSRYKPDCERRTRFRWTREADAALCQYYAEGYPLCYIAKNLDLTRSAVRNRIHILRLKRNFYRQRITPRELATIRRKYPDTPTHVLARELGRSICSIHRSANKLGVKKSAEFMRTGETGRLRPGSTIGIRFRFQKGQVPANKGLRRPGWYVGRMRETQFKKGQRPGNTMPIGTVKANADGYLRIKVSDIVTKPGQRGANDPNWKFVHRMVWEKAHGPIPKGHRIWWKDGNHQNCALENLELLTDKEHMARTTIHKLPSELKSTILWAGALKRRIRRIEREKQTKRPAQPPVRNHRAAQR